MGILGWIKNIFSPKLPFVISASEKSKMTDAVVRFVSKHQEFLAQSKIGTSKHTSELSAIREPIPQNGSSVESILRILKKDVYPNDLNECHPRFFDYIPAAPNPVSVLSHLISAGINPFVGSWSEGSGSTELELQTINWINQMIGFPKNAGGVFLNGGTEASMQGVRVGRKVILNDQLSKIDNSVIYMSDQVNSSIFKSLLMLGFDAKNKAMVKMLPTDDQFRLSLSALQNEINEDKKNGKIPFCVLANFGTSGTGAIDPISEIADICKSEGMWLHVDAAYGGGFITSNTFRTEFEKIGLNKADSIIINPHKAMFTAYGNSMLLVKDFSWLEEAYRGKDKASFLSDYIDMEVNFYQYGPDFTRNDRQALELWMAIKYYGIAEFGKAIDRLHHLAKFAAQYIEKDAHFKLITGPNLSIITFQYAPEGLSVPELNKLNVLLRNEVNDTQFANIGKITLNKKNLLRMCFLNPSTTEDDIIKTFKLINKLGLKITKEIKNVVIL